MPLEVNIPDLPLFLKMKRRAEGVVVAARSKILCELFEKLSRGVTREVFNEEGAKVATLWEESARLPRPGNVLLTGNNLTHLWLPDQGIVNLAFLRRTDLSTGFEMLLKQPVERGDFERAHGEAGHAINYIFTSFLGEQEVVLEVRLREKRGGEV